MTLTNLILCLQCVSLKKKKKNLADSHSYASLTFIIYTNINRFKILIALMYL